MIKRAVTVALICLSVLPLNTHAASAADIDGLIVASQSDAQQALKEKIAANQQLVKEITELEAQIAEIQASAKDKRGEINKELIIAAGTTIATTIAVVYLGRRNQSPDGAGINAGIKAVVAVLGATMTVKSLGSGGLQYLLLQVDEEKLPELQSKLSELKAELLRQTNELMK